MASKICIEISDKELAELIKAWIRDHSSRGKRKGQISDSILWQTLKAELKQIGHWKDYPRGDPGFH
jgi:hypothetical protein